MRGFHPQATPGTLAPRGAREIRISAAKAEKPAVRACAWRLRGRIGAVM